MVVGPDPHWYACLSFWRKAVGQAVQVHTTVAKRFSVIRYVHYGGIEVSCICKLDNFRVDVITVGNGVVVGVDQLLARTVLDIAAWAVWCIQAMRIGITAIICWAMRAYLVQHDQ